MGISVFERGFFSRLYGNYSIFLLLLSQSFLCKKLLSVKGSDIVHGIEQVLKNMEFIGYMRGSEKMVTSKPVVGIGEVSGKYSDFRTFIPKIKHYFIKVFLLVSGCH